MQRVVTLVGFWGSSGDWSSNENEINKHLQDGWKVVKLAPMGGYGSGTRDDLDTNHGFAAVVVIERN